MIRSSVLKVEKRIHNKENKVENIEYYDIDNLYPQRIKDIVNASGAAKRSVEVFAKFIVGGGFKDETFYKAIINKKGMTGDQLLRFIADDYSHFYGRAYHVNYNGLLQKYSITPVPYEYCRKGIGKKAGMIAVYEDWECSNGRLDPTKISWYHRFTTNKEEVLTQVAESGGLQNYKGQIYTNEKYPLSPIDPVIEDVISDKSIKTFTEKELKNGFNPSVIGRYSKSFDGEEGEEEWKRTNDDWKQFQGPENTGKVFLVAGVTKEDFDLTRIDSSGADKMYDLTEKRVKNSIIQRFGQPPSIVGRRDQNVTFSSQNIEDDTKFYNTVTSYDRLIIEEDMKLLFTDFHIPVNGTDDWSIMELTANAIATEKPSKISQLGPESTREMISVLVNQYLTGDQKISILIITFGFTLEEAQAQVLGVAVKQ